MSHALSNVKYVSNAQIVLSRIQPHTALCVHCFVYFSYIHFKKIFIDLAVPDLSCGTETLSCSMWDHQGSPYINSFIPYDNPVLVHNYYVHFINKLTEAQRAYITFLGSHS